MELQLFNSEQSLSLLDLLIINNYNHLWSNDENFQIVLLDIKKDLKNHIYENINKTKKIVTRTYIKIDEEKLLDINIISEEIDIARYKGKIYDNETKKWWDIVKKYGDN
jgi:hypothetical protein